MRKAVIDVGSNSVLLLVEQHDGHGWTLVEEATDVTALGEGTKETGLLSEEGMRRTLSALQSMFARARELGADPIVAAATMAARIAKNTPDFLERARAQGTPVTVLSGEDEAELGFKAVADDPTFQGAQRLSIIDPGGHSTELVTADHLPDGWITRFRKSYAIGTLGLRGQFMKSDRSEPSDVMTMLAAIESTLDDTWHEGDSGEVVVLGATGTNLVSIREGLETWQPEQVHGAVLTFPEISQFVGWTMPMSDAERAAIPGMEKGRERTIHIGALVLERFLFAIGAKMCRVSVRGWRYALLEG